MKTRKPKPEAPAWAAGERWPGVPELAQSIVSAVVDLARLHQVVRDEIGEAAMGRIEYEKAQEGIREAADALSSRLPAALMPEAAPPAKRRRRRSGGGR